MFIFSCKCKTAPVYDFDSGTILLRCFYLHNFYWLLLLCPIAADWRRRRNTVVWPQLQCGKLWSETPQGEAVHCLGNDFLGNHNTTSICSPCVVFFSDHSAAAAHHRRCCSWFFSLIHFLWNLILNTVTWDWILKSQNNYSLAILCIQSQDKRTSSTVVFAYAWW